MPNYRLSNDTDKICVCGRKAMVLVIDDKVRQLYCEDCWGAVVGGLAPGYVERRPRIPEGQKDLAMKARGRLKPWTSVAPRRP